MLASDLDFDLPPELIAQEPARRRQESRLLCYRRQDRSISHRRFVDLPGILRRGDLLVLNDTRVLPAQFVLRKSSGGRVEGLFLSQPAPGQWLVMLKNPGATPAGLQMHFEAEPSLTAEMLESLGQGEYRLKVAGDPAAILDRIGRMPLPPYIKRQKDHDSRDDLDRLRYQTVYARQPGAVAAPTAGLHFTPEILGELDAAGVERAMVTLHVGTGTFRPLTAERLEDHAMHAESYCIDAAAAAALNRAQSEGRRIIAVGTTSARVLESQPEGQPFVSRQEETSIFIYPPYRWKHVSGMITNFHMPRSTLVALVAALVGLDEQRRIYRQAIEQRYRFFSYGDAMLVE